MRSVERRDDLTVVVQAGGESKRMGTSKAFVPFLDEPLIMRSLKRLEPIAGELLITTNEPEKFGFLSDYEKFKDVRLCADLIDARGALNGMYTALESATLPFVATVACDMVFPSAPLILAELDAIEENGSDLAVPVNAHGFEPFHAVYRRETCLEYVRAAISSGEARAYGWYNEATVQGFTNEMVLAADPRGGCFINVNTPEQLHEMEDHIRREGMHRRDDVDGA